jgi:hypothetical protein
MNQYSGAMVLFKTIPSWWAPKYVRLGMSSAGNCKQIDIVSRNVSNNTERECNNLDEDFFCKAFDHTWSRKLGIEFAGKIQVYMAVYIDVKWTQKGVAALLAG